VGMLYFEDFTIGSTRSFGGYEVTKEEIVEFARRWDPQPFHVDEALAQASIFGGLTASACHTFAISSVLASRYPDTTKAVAGLGIEEMRFPNPVRPGDRLSFVDECVERRESRSRPTIGIVTMRATMMNQDGQPVMTVETTFMVEKRRPQDAHGDA
jgi:acyl dehydratase